MADWTLIGPPGTYAEGVFQGCLRSNRLEVAVKVVSLRNQHIHQSVSVQEKLRQKEQDGIKITEDVKLKVYEEKVLQEMYMQGTLSNKHICFFAGYHKESSSYMSKVLDNPSHDLHRAFRGSEEEGPRRDQLLFFVMEKLSGEDLHEYNASHQFGCGFLLAFEAAPDASNDQVKDALGRFPPFRAAYDALAPELKEKESPADYYKQFLYLDAEHRFLYDHKGGQFLVLKFNTKFKCIDRSRYRCPEPQTFCEDVRTHLDSLRLICNCESMTKKQPRDNTKFLYRPLPLFFDQTFIRTVLTHIMIALNHAHGTPMYHDDLKPDNIMFKYPVHAHSTHESKICAKVIDWGCCGFSKGQEGDSRHQY